MEKRNKPGIELDSLMTDTEKRLLYGFLTSFSENLAKSSALKGKKLRVVIEPKKEGIPVAIFSRGLGMLEAIVKHLHEDKGQGFGEIATILKRSPNNIQVSYLNSKAKHPGHLSRTKSEFYIPLTIFSSRHTCFESVCLYLRDDFGLSFSQIGKLLERDERTVWTIYKRAKKKVKNG